MAARTAGPKATPVTGVTAPAACSVPSIPNTAILQHYHRQVTLMLLPAAPPGRPALRLLLDQEPQRPGEDEVQTALRLLRRVLARYPRAFDLVLADALYAVAPFFNFLLTHHKHALVVLKQERHDLYVDAMALFAQQAPKLGLYRGRRCEC